MREKPSEAKDPTQLFFTKAKRKPWLIDIYIAIQAAMAFNTKKNVDFDILADVIRPRSDRIPRAGYSIGEEGLDILGILFDCECVERGDTNYHEYRFTRKSDGRSVIGTIKV